MTAAVMPLAQRFGLNDRQAEFARLVSLGTSPGDSALKAGYKSPEQAWQIVAHPHVAAAIHYELQRQIMLEGAPLAYKTIVSIIKNEKASERVRGDLSVRLLNLAGFVPPTPVAQKDQSDKSLSEMTAAELVGFIDRNQAEIARLEAELAARAKDVTPGGIAQDMPVIEAKPLNFLD